MASVQQPVFVDTLAVLIDVEIAGCPELLWLSFMSRPGQYQMPCSVDMAFDVYTAWPCAMILILPCIALLLEDTLTFCCSFS